MTTAPAEFLTTRHGTLRSALSRLELDALLVSAPANIAYLSGFFGSAGTLLLHADGLHLFSDTRYASVLADLGRDVPGLHAVVVRPGQSSVDEEIVRVLGELGLSRVGFEASHLTVRRHVDLTRRLALAGRVVELVATDEVVLRLRAVKDAWWRSCGRRAGGFPMSLSV
ncbi:MAG: aminopeptidase P family N-terminal domain-containing protein [Vicinamibacterales bacterium]